MEESLRRCIWFNIYQYLVRKKSKSRAI